MSSPATLSRRGVLPPRWLSLLRPFSLGLLAVGLGTVALAQNRTQLSYERILNSRNEPGNWLTYGGDYSGQRHSTLTQITPANVANLKTMWVYQSGDASKWEVTPIVVDGIMYITERPNIVTALDTRTGRPLIRP